MSSIQLPATTPGFAKTLTSTYGVITGLKLWKLDDGTALASVTMTGRTKLVRDLVDSLDSITEKYNVAVSSEKVAGGWREVEVVATLAAVKNSDALSDALCDFIDAVSAR